jgi:hypothetical protein
MLYLTVASLIVALIAVGFAVKQTNIAKAMQDKQDEEQKEVCDWQLRHEAVAIQLSRINPLLRVRYPDDVTRVIYTNLFPDPPYSKQSKTTLFTGTVLRHVNRARTNCVARHCETQSLRSKPSSTAAERKILPLHIISRVPSRVSTDQRFELVRRVDRQFKLVGTDNSVESASIIFVGFQWVLISSSRFPRRSEKLLI